MRLYQELPLVTIHLVLVSLLNVIARSGAHANSQRSHQETFSDNVNNDSTGTDPSISSLDLDIRPLETSKENQLHSLLHIRRPKITVNKNDDFEESEGYIFGVHQGSSSPGQMGGINIKNEARWLANKLRILSNEEMGVTSMQVSSPLF
jgi:hypothetical protein